MLCGPLTELEPAAKEGGKPAVLHRSSRLQSPVLFSITAGLGLCCVRQTWLLRESVGAQPESDSHLITAFVFKASD